VEVNQGTTEFQDGGYENVLYAPLGGDWLISEVLGGLRAVAFDMAAPSGEVGPEVGEHLPQTGFRRLSAIQRPEAAVGVVETVTELIKL